MLPVSGNYINATKRSTIRDRISGRITLPSGDVDFTERDIFVGTLYINRSVTSGDSIEIGSANVGEMGVELNLTIDPAELYGGKITLTYELETAADVWEPVPLGTFWIDEAERRDGGGLILTAYDRMTFFDVPLEQHEARSATAWISLLCFLAGVNLNTSAVTISHMPNADAVLSLPSDGSIKTCRDMLMWVCQHIGAVATINANDTLDIIQITSKTSSETIGVRQQYSAKYAETTVRITSIAYGDIAVGSGDVVLSLDENPLWEETPTATIETYLTNILFSIATLEYTPATIAHTGNPAFEPCDVLTANKPDGTEAEVFVTVLNWRHGGAHDITSAGFSIVKGKRYSQVQKSVSSVEQIVRLTKEIAEAAKSTSDDINNAIGGNVLIRQESGGTNEILIMDDPDPAQAVKIWRWNMGGLGYSDNVVGADNPARTYSVAITMSGAISANFITTGILKAILIETVEINCNDKFTVQPDGTMTATSGTIGGWDISDEGLFLPTEDGIEPVEVWNDNNQIVTTYTPPEPDGKIASFYDDVAARHCQTFEITPFKAYKIENSERVLLTNEKIQDIEPDGQGNKNIYDGEWLEPSMLGIFNIIKTKYRYVTFIDDNIMFLEPIEAGTKTAVGMWNETADYKGYSQIAKDVVSGIQYLSPSGVSSIVFHAGFEPDKDDPADSRNSFYITQSGLAHTPTMLVKDTLFVKNYPQGITAPQVIIEDGKIKTIDGISQITISDDEIQAQQGINALGKIIFMENETRIENKTVTITEKLIADADVEFWSLPTVYDPAQGRPNNSITVYNLYIDGNGKIYRDETPITNKATD